MRPGTTSSFYFTILTVPVALKQRLEYWEGPYFLSILTFLDCLLSNVSVRQKRTPIIYFSILFHWELYLFNHFGSLQRYAALWFYTLFRFLNKLKIQINSAVKKNFILFTFSSEGSLFSTFFIKNITSGNQNNYSSHMVSSAISLAKFQILSPASSPVVHATDETQTRQPPDRIGHILHISASGRLRLGGPGDSLLAWNCQNQPIIVLASTIVTPFDPSINFL